MRKYLRHKVKISKWSSGSWYMVPATFLPKQMQLPFFAKASGHLRSYGKGRPPGTTKRWENFPTFRFFLFFHWFANFNCCSTFDVRFSLKSLKKILTFKKKSFKKESHAFLQNLKKQLQWCDRFWVGPLPCPLPRSPRPASETSAPHRNPRWIHRSGTSELEEVFFRRNFWGCFLSPPQKKGRSHLNITKYCLLIGCFWKFVCWCLWKLCFKELQSVRDVPTKWNGRVHVCKKTYKPFSPSRLKD